MTQPVPEEANEALDVTEPPEDEHGSDLPDEGDAPDKAQGPVDPSGPGGIDSQPPPGGPNRTDGAGRAGEPGDPQVQEENAEAAVDQPSDSAGSD